MTRPGSKRRPTPPGHLSQGARALWAKLHQTYAIDLEASLLLLTALAEAWDQCRACRLAMKGQPMFLTDRHGGIRAHPMIAEARAAREQLGRFSRLLRIHVEGPDDAA